MVKGQHVHRHTDADAFGALRDHRRQLQWVRSRQKADQVLFGQPDAVIAKALGQESLLEHLLIQPRRRLAAIPPLPRKEQVEVHLNDRSG